MLFAYAQSKGGLNCQRLTRNQLTVCTIDNTVYLFLGCPRARALLRSQSCLYRGEQPLAIRGQPRISQQCLTSPGKREVQVQYRDRRYFVISADRKPDPI